MVRRTRVGVQFTPQHMPDYGRLRDAVRRGEDAGVDVAFNWDHFFPLWGDPDGTHFECWTMLAAWAEQTSRIEIGALVSCNGYRNPDLLVDMARTVDHISEGRLILGIGSGWNHRDFTEYGYQFGTASGRLDQLAVALPRIESRLGRLNPPPVRKLPVLIGGDGERKTLPLVAAHADIWHTYAVGQAYSRKQAVLTEHCTALGRDPAEIELSASVGGEPAHHDVKRLLTEADALTDLGATMIVICCDGPDYDLTSVEALCRWRDRHR